MYKLLPRHLGPRTALIISLLLTIIMAAHTWNTIAHSSKRLTASIKQQADVMARSIANLSVGYVLLNDFGSLETLLLRNVEFPDIVSISVSDPQGKVLSCVLHEGEKTRAVYDHHHIEVPNVAKPMITSHAGKITVWEPIVDANLLGWVKAVYSFKAVESIRKTILLDGVVNGLLVVAVSVVLILIFLGRYMAVFNKVTTFAGSLN
ncbi:MAG: hypothetical protein OEL66_05135, partial [Desulfobulbaceae bacterium]|nr:hypothetical protein [Desulfobulbaceae bacterium]